MGEGRSLRRPKRYNVVNSPLTAVHWWRVMLDEAQNVGDGFSQVGSGIFLKLGSESAHIHTRMQAALLCCMSTSGFRCFRSELTE